MAEQKEEMTLEERALKAAERYLELSGFDVVEESYSCPHGEADIIAWDGDQLVFVEVGISKDLDRGFPTEDFSAKKRQKCELVAASYLSKTDDVDFSVRFDIISMLVTGAQRAFVRHQKNAYEFAF